MVNLQNEGVSTQQNKMQNSRDKNETQEVCLHLETFVKPLLYDNLNIDLYFHFFVFTHIFVKNTERNQWTSVVWLLHLWHNCFVNAASV